MKVIYVAGKYRDEHPYQVWDHINIARQLAVEIWKIGHVALCPHMNSMFMEGSATGEQFIEGTLELMRRCDAVLVCPNYLSSVGTLGEIEEAKNIKIPVLYSLEEVKKWLLST